VGARKNLNTRVISSIGCLRRTRLSQHSSLLLPSGFTMRPLTPGHRISCCHGRVPARDGRNRLRRCNCASVHRSSCKSSLRFHRRGRRDRLRLSLLSRGKYRIGPPRARPCAIRFGRGSQSWRHHSRRTDVRSFSPGGSVRPSPTLADIASFARGFERARRGHSNKAFWHWHGQDRKIPRYRQGSRSDCGEGAAAP
jgi:hypothetical protein